jgi:hypothetical protein
MTTDLCGPLRISALSALRQFLTQRYAEGRKVEFAITMSTRIITLLLLVPLFFSTAAAQAPRTPTEVTREFYKLMRDKKFREAFAISIYRYALEGLSQQELDDLQSDFEKMATAVGEGIQGPDFITGEQISGDTAAVFLKVPSPDGKEKTEPISLMKLDNAWVIGDKDSLALVKKQGKKFFFEARINAHHSDVQDILTRITLAQVVYSQGHNGLFGNMAELVAAGLVPKDIEGIESTGYRFQIVRAPDGKSWYATAEPTQYGRMGRLSFFLDASGVRSGDVGGKPLVVKN